MGTDKTRNSYHPVNRIMTIPELVELNKRMRESESGTDKQDRESCEKKRSK